MLMCVSYSCTFIPEWSHRESSVWLQQNSGVNLTGTVARGPGEAGIPSLHRVSSEAHRPRPRASEASSPGAAEPPGLRRLMSRSPARPVSVENTSPPLTPQPRYGRREHELQPL